MGNYKIYHRGKNWQIKIKKFHNRMAPSLLQNGSSLGPFYHCRMAPSLVAKMDIRVC
jgi:hypothetical protein